MTRLDNETKQKIIRLILNSVSIPKISQKLNLGKSTIYYYYKKLKGKKFIVPSFYIRDNEVEGEIVGAFAADGCAVPQSQYQVAFYFSLDEEDYAQSFLELLTKFFNKKPYFYRYPKGGKIIVRYKSKDIYKFLKHYLTWEGKKTYSVSLKNSSHSRGFYKGFIRGYLDCDGYTTKDRSAAHLFGVSKKMIIQIGKIIEILGFKYSFIRQEQKGNRVAFYRTIIKGYEARRFLKYIRPRNKKRVGLPGFEPGTTSCPSHD